MEHFEMSKRFVARHFPASTVAVVGGSTARGTRTATSDIDLLIIGDALFADGRTSLAATYEFEGETFEVFAYTDEAFDDWARRGMADYRPVIVHMLVEGIELRASTDLEKLRSVWGGLLTVGPTLTQYELNLRRYVISDLVDDLRDALDRLERYVIAGTLFDRIAELVLLTNHCWIGKGKYLPRRLREFSVERADDLAEPLLRGDFAAFADRAEQELSIVGGRVRAGFVR